MSRPKSGVLVIFCIARCLYGIPESLIWSFLVIDRLVALSWRGSFILFTYYFKKEGVGGKQEHHLAS